MKHLKKFNEILSMDNTKKWDFIIVNHVNDAVGFLKDAVLDNTDMKSFNFLFRGDSQILKIRSRISNYPNEFYLSNDGISRKMGGDHYRCFIKDRKTSMDLKEFIISNCKLDIPLDNLYTDNPKHLDFSIK